MIEVLKMVKSVTFIKIKSPGENQPPPRDLTKKFSGGQDFAIFEIFLEVAWGGGGGGRRGDGND